MAEKGEAAEAAPKKSNKMLMIIIIVVAVLAAGGGAYYLLKPKDEAAEAKEKAAAIEPGAVVALDPVTINLADGHYLKMSFALQAVAEVAEEPDGSKALDIAINQYTDMKIGELSTVEGRKKAKEALKEKIVKAYEKEEEGQQVMDLYITSFVTQ